MKLHDLLIPTGIAKEEMKVRDVFRLCLDAGVPAVPFMDHQGKLVGYAGLESVMHKGCLPNYMVELATVLGNDLSCISNAEQKVQEVMSSPINLYVTKPIRAVSSDAPVIKALAILEKFNSNFLFVFDGDVYRGVITAAGIAQKMIDIDRQADVDICHMPIVEK